MTTALAEKTEYRIPAPELRGNNFALGACRDTECLLDGPAGTGKTVAILYKIHLLLLSCAGSKWLITRRYNVDLAGSAMATYQAMLDPHEGVYYYGGSKVKPAGYIYPNGSFLAVNGLDRPGRLKSFECDGVYINEATECEIDHLEYARMRLRKGTMPYQQIIMDTNPDAPTHWLNERMNSGLTTRLVSRHEDNPRYFDLATNDWTEEGRRYIFGILGGLTGVRLARYRYGLWAAAEGTVYQDVWNRAKNVIDPFRIPWSWPRYLVIDFGYSHPFVCKWYAIDPDGRLVCYREIYKTKKLVADHCIDIHIASGWFHLLPKSHPRYNSRPAEWADPMPREVICDHDAEDRATFERHSGLYTTPAHKGVSDGIQAVAARLRPAGDGIPRLRYFRNLLIERDMDLAQAKKPTSGLEEFDVYVWKRDASGAKDEPVKENDHSLDCDGCMVAAEDVKPSTVSYYRSPWR